MAAAKSNKQQEKQQEKPTSQQQKMTKTAQKATTAVHILEGQKRHSGAAQTAQTTTQKQ